MQKLSISTPDTHNHTPPSQYLVKCGARMSGQERGRPETEETIIEERKVLLKSALSGVNNAK